MAALVGASLAACNNSSDGQPQTLQPMPADMSVLRDACVTSLDYDSQACQQHCTRLPDSGDSDTCAEECNTRSSSTAALCEAPLDEFEAACAATGCAELTDSCRTDVASHYDRCISECPDDGFRCRNQCDNERSVGEQHCGFLPTEVTAGHLPLPVLEQGEPAFLPGLLDEAELDVIAAADLRAETLRSRIVQLWTGQPDTAVQITQLEYDFSFGVPLDIREFEDAEDDLAFYGDIARKHTSLLVAETSLKWRNAEPEQGVFRYDLADTELDWAEMLGFDVKAHVLMWGNDPPLASGSGTPEWLRDKFPNEDLSAEEVAQLRALIRDHITRVVSRYSGRIDVWEVTNEMLNPLTDWFAVRLGPDIVNDVFRWARQADPGAELVYNEWIKEIFTGLGGPDAPAVRDRIMALLAAGVPVDALGQQGHFAPGLVNVGVDVDLSQRTRVDDYARALDTLAEAGLPIHITEVTFAAPEEPEHRAAQAEAIMRIWWGHPAVREIIFWNFWNPLGPRSHLNLGIYGDDGNLTRHGEAILSLLNDRWRTRIAAISDENGTLQFRATHGEYLAQWSSPEGPAHVRFRVAPGPDGLNVVAVSRNGEGTPP